MPVITFPITLVKSFMITPKVKHFVFKCDLSPAFHFLPGQFITIHFEREGKTFKRSYSIANEPKQDNTIEFAADFVEGGPGTELLFNLNAGDQIQINGPFGRLTLKDEIPGRYIFVATSTGVTPFRAMLSQLKQRMENNPNLHIVFLQGVQKKEDLLYADDFYHFAQNHPQVRFIPCFSREAKESIQGEERCGYVQHTFPELNLNPMQDVVYLCGSAAMIDESFIDLKNRSFAMQQVIREKYISN